MRKQQLCHFNYHLWASISCQYSSTAFEISLYRALSDSEYANKYFTDFYFLLSSDSLNVQVDEKLIKIDRRNMEYFMFYSAIILLEFKTNLHHSNHTITSQNFYDVFKCIPNQVLPDFRKKRQYISSILSKNEIFRQDPYNKKIFKRIYRGHYILNPELKIKMNGEWFKTKNYGIIPKIISA